MSRSRGRLSLDQLEDRIGRLENRRARLAREGARKRTLDQLDEKIKRLRQSQGDRLS